MKSLAISFETITATAIVAACGVGAAHWGMNSEAPLVVTVGGSVAGGILGNFSDRLMCRASNWLLACLSESWRRGELPPNHDLARAVREAQIRAVESVAGKLISFINSDDLETDRTRQATHRKLDQFQHGIGKWVSAAKKQLSSTLLTEADFDLMQRAAARVTHRLLINPTPDDASARMVAAWVEAGRLLLTEIRASKMVPYIPPKFVEVMEGRDNIEGITWANATLCYFTESLKADTPVYRIVMLDLVRELAIDNQKHHREVMLMRDQILVAIQKEAGPLASQLHRIDTKLDAISDSLEGKFQALNERLNTLVQLFEEKVH